MINLDEESLICDFAETYQILDFRALKPTLAAVLAKGLRESSRIKMKLTDSKVPLETLILAKVADMTSVLVWQNTKDGSTGNNPPNMITEKLITIKPPESDLISFDSAEDFLRAWNEE